VGVSTYNGAFGKIQAERLLWRAGFGAREGEAAKLAKLGLEGAVQSLTRPGSDQLVGPDPKNDRGFPLSPTAAFGEDHLWWLDRMIRSTTPLVERMTLVWHDWFATSNQGVGSQQLMINQNQLLRKHALGSFRQLLLDVTTDPAMLVWLNGNQNVRQRPNENYSRELMELFSLGANRGAYTETDVRELARALTGWTGSVQRGVPTAFTFNQARYDTGLKSVFGQRGAFNWQDAVRLCLDHPLHPSFFVQKLWSAFVPTRLDPSTMKGLQELYSNREVRPVVEAILKHPAFYEGPRMVKPPVVFNAGLLRMRGRWVDASTWWSLSAEAGQRLFYPPDVGGWDDSRWLDTGSFRARWFIAALVQGSRQPSDSPRDPAKLVQRALRYWSTPTISAETRTILTAFAQAQLKRKHSPATVETALRRLVATSPDLQTA
jgi:uncharacterized protein (DUF1800 family)